MKVELIFEPNQKIAVIRLLPENEPETAFLKVAYQEGLRVFEGSSSGAIGMALPSIADLKQFHVPKEVVAWLNEILSEGFN